MREPSIDPRDHGNLDTRLDRCRPNEPAIEQSPGWREVLSLPLYAELPLESVERICAEVRAFYGTGST